MSARKQPRQSNIVEFKTDPRKGLTFKQVKFCEQYILCDGCKSKAAMRAGYSAKSSIWQGSELAKNPLVQAYITYLLKDQQADIMASISEVKQRMTKGLRGELKDEVIVTKTVTTHKKDKKGRNVTVTKSEPMIVEKRISLRDSIEAAKLYGQFLQVNDDGFGNANETTDDKLLKALGKRNVQIQIPTNVTFEEDEVDVDAEN